MGTWGGAPPPPGLEAGGAPPPGLEPVGGPGAGQWSSR